MYNQELRELLAKHSAVRFGFSRPDWDAIRTAVKAAGADFTKLATGLARMWMDRTAEEFGDGGRTDVAGTRTYALMPRTAATEAAMQWVEDSIQELHVLLAGIVPEQGEHLAVLLFDDDDAFVNYVSDFFLEDGEDDEDRYELAHSGSNHVLAGFPQIVAYVGDGHMQASLAHGLACWILSDLNLPHWLGTGIVQSMETLLSKSGWRPSAYDLDVARGTWDPESIQRFWSGVSFSDEASDPSHTMAYVFAQSLSRSYDRLVRFVSCPNLSTRDGGDAAFRKEYGHGLEDLAAQFLGPGSWAPDADAIARIEAEHEAEARDEAW